MSSQKIELDIRHAIWLAHKRRCAYCTEPLSFAEVDIDHVIPEVMSGKAELSELLNSLDLPPEFDLFSHRNLLPAHRRCNLAKTSSLFNEASVRFFLHEADKVRTTVEKLVASKVKREGSEHLISAVLNAFRTGLISPMDIRESQYPNCLRLTKPIQFADASDQVIDLISPEEVEKYLDRPVLIGGNPVFATEFGDDNGIRMTVRTCREYRAALAAGFYTKTTYDIKSEAFLKTTNAILAAAASVRVPLVSYVRVPHRGVTDLDLFPSSVLPYMSSNDEKEILRMKDLSLADLLENGEIKILSVSSDELSLEWKMGLMLREICRADFDGDGIEDILCECYSWATEGTFGFGWAILLTRKDENSTFAISNF